MPANILTRLGNGLRAAHGIHFDGASLALGASALGALTATLTPMLRDQSSALSWLVDLAAHWQWLYVIVGIVSGATLLLRGSALPVALATALIGAGWLSASDPVPVASAASQPRFTVASANLKVGQADLDALHRWVSDRGVDILVLQEVTEATALAVAQWQDYPSQLVTPEDGPFGLAVLSRYPLTDIETRESFEQPLRYRTFVSWQGRRVGISAIHPMPPISPIYHERRAQMLQEEAYWAHSAASPSIVVGDLNASPWSSAMRAIAPAGLRRATGLQPTWPSLLPVIPIDHVLTSEAWEVVESGVGPAMGSDHRPVFAVLSLTSSAICEDCPGSPKTEIRGQMESGSISHDNGDCRALEGLRLSGQPLQ